MQKTRGFYKGGFTLIELLIVIAILTLLLAILLPSLTAAKDLAKMAVCVSNIRVLGIAQTMYAHEKTPDKRISYMEMQGATSTEGVLDFYATGHHWGDLMIWEQFATQDHFKCPAENTPVTKAGRSPTHYGMNYYLYYYHQNSWGGSLGGAAANQVGSRATIGKYGPSLLRDIKRPSRTIMVSEAKADPAFASTALWEYRFGGHYRHAGPAAAYSFFDGHSKAYSFEEMFHDPYIAGRPLNLVPGIGNGMSTISWATFPEWAGWLK